MVSVIIPYYNRPEKILRCVNSVLEQTYQEFEILIIDDHSIQPLRLNLDPRIHVIRNEVNIGPGASRNVGLDHAKGEYIAFLDSDDYWHKDFLKITYHNLSEDSSLAFVYTQTDAFKGKVRLPFKKKFESRTRIMPDILLKKRVWTTSSCLWRSEIIGECRFINTRNWEDYVFDVEVSLRNNNIKPIEQVLCFYDSDGSDKLSKVNYYNRLQEKTYSIFRVFDLVKNTMYFSQDTVKKFFRHELLTALESYNKFEDKTRIKSYDIITKLKLVESPVNLLLIAFIFKYAPKKYLYSLINKIKKSG